MSRPKLEVADVFRVAGQTYRDENAGHLSLQQHKVMSATVEPVCSGGMFCNALNVSMFRLPITLVEIAIARSAKPAQLNAG